MGDVRILIDIPADQLEKVEEVAAKEHRSRKAQLELIIQEFVEMEREVQKR